MSLIECEKPVTSKHKRGDTWQPLPFYIDIGTGSEGAVFWSTLEIKCDLRKILPDGSTADDLLAHVEVVKSDGGWFYLSVPAAVTETWLVGQRAKYDIQLTYNGQVVSTPTFYFIIVEDETHA
jgi:hypothetical protein